MILDMEVCTTGRVGACCGSIGYTPSGGGGGTTDYDKLTNKPKLNGETIQDNKQSKDYGLYGTNNPEVFVYVQSTPSDRWEITHNLNKRPSITVVDSAGSVLMGEYEYVNGNTVICTFSSAFSGECYLN